MIKGIFDLSINKIKQLRSSGEFEQKSNLALENAYKCIEAVIINASDKSNLDDKGDLLRHFTQVLCSDRNLVELYLPIVNLLVIHGANTKPANFSYQAELDKVISMVITKDNMKLFKAALNPQSIVNTLPSDILAKIHTNILTINNPKLFG